MIRQTFATLRDDARKISPFTQGQFSDTEIMTAVRNCQGWSMVSPVPSVQIVEFFLQHPNIRPIQKLVDPCVHALKEVYSYMQNEADNMLTKCDQFQNFVSWTKTEMHSIFKEDETNVTQQIKHAILVEEAYIFTDNNDFLKEWMTASTQKNMTSSSYPSTLRSILSVYFSVVAESIANYIPKLIVYTLTNTLNTLQQKIAPKLELVTNLDKLLMESEETEKLRIALTSTLSTADACLKTLDVAMK
jgi:hypothetical protein